MATAAQAVCVKVEDSQKTFIGLSSIDTYLIQETGLSSKRESPLIWWYSDKDSVEASIHIQQSQLTSKYIELSQEFASQFSRVKETFEDTPFQVAKDKFSNSLSSLLGMELDAISIELTHDKSVFYTVKKWGFSAYIQHYLYDVSPDEDEAIMVLFRGKSKLPSIAGALDTVISHLRGTLPNGTMR